MIKIKKGAFTLSEVLITLAVVGTLAALVVPGLIKDVNSKAMMALLQGTTSNLYDTVQAELVKTGATNLKDTDIYNNPKKFFEKLDVAKASADNTNFPNLNNYKLINGSNLTSIEKNCKASAKLKNGVTLCMSTFEPISELTVSPGSTKKAQSSTVFIDLNGDNPPNIAGVDFWGVYIDHTTMLSVGEGTLDRHVGDIWGPSGSLEKCTSNNTKWTPLYCFYHAQTSGFDHNYWKNN